MDITQISDLEIAEFLDQQNGTLNQATANIIALRQEMQRRKGLKDVPTKPEKSSKKEEK